MPGESQLSGRARNKVAPAILLDACGSIDMNYYGDVCIRSHFTATRLACGCQHDS